MRRLLIRIAALMGRLRRALSLADDPLPAEVLALVDVTATLALATTPAAAEPPKDHPATEGEAR